jgi:hypothetical protein
VEIPHAGAAGHVEPAGELQQCCLFHKLKCRRNTEQLLYTLFLLQQFGMFGKSECHHQPACTESPMPMVMQPMSIIPVPMHPMCATHMCGQPMMAPFAVQPTCNAPGCVHSMMAPTAVPPMASPMPSQAMAGPSVGLPYQAPMAGLAAGAPNYPPQAASGLDTNQALERVTAQLATLTHVIEKHIAILTSHEKRVGAVEEWIAEQDMKAKKVSAGLPEPLRLPK